MNGLKNILRQLIFKIDFNDCVSRAANQQTFDCLKPTIETLGKGVK